MGSIFTLVATLALSIIINLLFFDRTNVDCLRFVKDITRPKSRCQWNFTYAPDLTPAPPTCVALNNPYCLDIKLPYNSTIIPETIPDFTFRSFEHVHNYLKLWEGARKLPKCWPILQVALCSVLMPQCDENHTTGRATRFYKSSIDICNDLVNRDECKFIERKFSWATLFNCNDTNVYSRNCANELRDLKFSASLAQSTCQHPLVATNDETTWFKDVGGCALNCKFPLSSQHDQENINLFIRILSLVGLSCTGAAIILFRANQINGQKTSKLAKVIKRCNICQFILYTGWSLQILLNNDVACNSNGSALYGQPLVASPCVLSFLLTYLPSLSSLFWCAHLGKLCHEKLIGRSESSKSPTNPNLNPTLSLLNYGIPLTLCICAALLGHIDGHGLYGICTVGQQSMWIKIIFVFTPLLLGTIYGNYYFIRIVIRLAFVKTTMKPSLRRNLLRIFALAALTIMQSIFAIGNYYYELDNKDRWIDSIDNYLACNVNLQYDYFTGPAAEAFRQPDCHIDTKPIVTIYYIELFANLALGLVIASWSFHESNFRGLRRKLIDLLEDEKDRQRRARSYFQVGESFAAGGRTHAWLTNKVDNAKYDETHHDLIDMTSPTHMDTAAAGAGTKVVAAATAAATDGGEVIELTSDVGEIEQLSQVIPSQHGPETPMSRRPSLQSVSLDYSMANASIQNNLAFTVGHSMARSHQQGGNKYSRHFASKERTSRQVVNEAKQINALQFQAPSTMMREQQHQMQIYDQMKVVIKNLVNDLTPKTDDMYSVSEPGFMHGMSANPISDSLHEPSSVTQDS